MFYQKLSIALIGLSLGVGALAEGEPDLSAASHWTRQGEQQLESSIEAYRHLRGERGDAKNIILFVGDGMSLGTIAAARILDGQNKGHTGEENVLSFERFRFTGLAKTYNTDAQTPDSAGTMTALITGAKTRAGLIAVNETVARGDCQGMRGQTLTSALELAERQGMATGIVTTTRVTHATPAAAYAKSPERNWEADADVPLPARGSCADIAAQLINFTVPAQLSNKAVAKRANPGIEVVLGGGAGAFLPAEKGGRRVDGRDLIREWQGRFVSGNFVQTAAELRKAKASDRAPLLGLFNASHMQYESERKATKSSEPSLTEMTETAIAHLQAYKTGYFLVVEGGRIDHAHHAGNAYHALSDTIELAKAVERADALTDIRDTLIIVTADHGHVFSFAGYPKRGNPVLGKVVPIGAKTPALALDGLPYTTLSYANGPGFANFQEKTDADRIDKPTPKNWQTRPDLTHIDTTRPGFHQPALVPLSAETHSGEDVAIFARGPGAQYLTGSMEQTQIFYVMEHAGDLRGRSEKAKVGDTGAD